MGGAEIFEDVTDSGFRLTYFVADDDSYVAILRLRKEIGK